MPLGVDLLGKGKPNTRVKGIGKGTDKMTREKVDALIRRGEALDRTNS